MLRGEFNLVFIFFLSDFMMLKSLPKPKIILFLDFCRELQQ